MSQSIQQDYVVGWERARQGLTRTGCQTDAQRAGFDAFTPTGQPADSMLFYLRSVALFRVVHAPQVEPDGDILFA